MGIVKLDGGLASGRLFRLLTYVDSTHKTRGRMLPSNLTFKECITNRSEEKHKIFVCTSRVVNIRRKRENMPVRFDSRDVAAYIAQQCKAHKIEYNNTKIQKLLYCAYGILLAWSGDRICDEYPRAWDAGPVFPKVFTYFREHGDIAGYSDEVRNADDADGIKSAVSSTLKAFGKYKASRLSAWSHKTGSPWDRTVYGDSANEGAGLYGFIPDDFIRDYFHDKVIAYA